MTIYGRSEELVCRCVGCDLAEPESLASLGGSAPGVVDGILSTSNVLTDALSQIPAVTHCHTVARHLLAHPTPR